MNILFINGSPNKNGNTAALAEELLRGKAYETLNLTDYTIGAYGQQLPGDELDHFRDGKGQCNRPGFSTVLAQYLRKLTQCAGSVLWKSRQQRPFRTNAIFSISRR